MIFKGNRAAVAVLELVVAAAFWGFGFIAVKWGLASFGPYELTFMRFFLATLLSLPLFLFRSGRLWIGETWKLAFWPALLLSCTLLLQTSGLQYTTPTKSGFITTLYVVFVPVLESFLTGRPVALRLWGCVGLALFGTALIVNTAFVGQINWGDILTFGCALAAAGQIYILGVVSPKVRQPFVFNLVQSIWACALCLPLVSHGTFWPNAFDGSRWTWQVTAGVLSLAFGSTVIAFYLQVRAQAHLSATLSSLLFLLESPFAMVFAIVLLGDRLSLLEAAGAALILLSAFVASLMFIDRPSASGQT